MKIVLVCMLALVLSACTSHARSIPLKQLQEKLKSDEVALGEFVALGKLHCLDSYFHQNNGATPNELFTMGYATTFNGLTAFTRLVDEQKLFDIFNATTATAQLQKSIDPVGACHVLYEKHGQNLYQSFIMQKDNYIHTNPKHPSEQTHHQQNIQDYLQYGKLDARRFSESCQTVDCQ